MDELLLEVDVAEIEPDRLRAPQPGRVDELDKRAVSQPEGLAVVELVDDRLHLGQIRRVREPPRPPR